jgi:hypothetical protein
MLAILHLTQLWLAASAVPVPNARQLEFMELETIQVSERDALTAAEFFWDFDVVMQENKPPSPLLCMGGCDWSVQHFSHY